MDFWKPYKLCSYFWSTRFLIRCNSNAVLHLFFAKITLSMKIKWYEIINGSDARINFNVDYDKTKNDIINGIDTRINFNVDYGNYNIKHLDIQLNKRKK